jgi:hypothetical protein
VRSHGSDLHLTPVGDSHPHRIEKPDAIRATRTGGQVEADRRLVRTSVLNDLAELEAAGSGQQKTLGIVLRPRRIGV